VTQALFTFPATGYPLIYAFERALRYGLHHVGMDNVILLRDRLLTVPLAALPVSKAFRRGSGGQPHSVDAGVARLFAALHRVHRLHLGRRRSAAVHPGTADAAERGGVFRSPRSPCASRRHGRMHCSEILSRDIFPFGVGLGGAQRFYAPNFINPSAGAGQRVSLHA
jgi:hypothetical protein